MARARAARAEPRPMRLFVAVDVPERERRALARALAPWREALPGARWSPPENWHVTLKFLGSVAPGLRGWVGEALATAARAAGPFATRLTAMGAFPSSRRARVLWAGLADPHGRFEALSSALDAALEREFAPEARAFTPHLTVARFREQVALDPAVLAVDVPGAEFEVGELVLYRSVLQRPHARYEPIERFPLRVA